MNRAFKKVFNRFSILLFLMLSGSNSTVASIAVPMPLDDKVQKSEVIAHARLIDTKSSWRGGKIFTQAEFQIVEKIVGSNVATGDQIIVEMLGGRAEHPVLKVPVAQLSGEFVSFTAGDEVILFTRASPSNVHTLVGGVGGAVRVRTNSKSGKVTVESSAKNVRFEREPQQAQPNYTTNKSATTNGAVLMLRHDDYTLEAYLQRLRLLKEAETKRANQ